MPTFVVTERQVVLAVREVEAATEEEALAEFGMGDGKSVGQDGKVITSDVVSVEMVSEESHQSAS